MEEPIKKVKQENDKSHSYNDQTKEGIWEHTSCSMDEEARQQELEKIRQRRIQREKEKEKLLEKKQKETQQKEELTYEDWIQKEKQFHDDQNKIRSKLRIEQQRYQPVDYFSETIMVYKGEASKPKDVQYMKNPELIVKKLSSAELLNCLTEAERYCQQEGIQIMQENQIYKQLWIYFIDLINDRLEAYTLNEDDQEIEAMLKEKTVKDLDDLENSIKSTYRQADFKMDMGYFEKVLRKIRFNRAKGFLNNFYLKFDAQQGNEFIMNQTDLVEKIQIIISNNDTTNLNHINGNQSPILHNRQDDLQMLAISEKDAQSSMNALRLQSFQKEMSLIYEIIRRKLVDDGKIPETQPITETIIRKLHDRNSISSINTFQNNNPLQQDEQQFDETIDLVQKYAWMDKFKPRKPQYYNRVKYGYEWNKYNQAHYDMDNPPPKVVQGYKFNIFYPDLIDKTATPSYSLHNCDNDNFCMVKFSAGPPYEDIAFKVVKSEWEFNDRHGYKCVFQNGILHLYVNFKKYRYKR